MDRAAGMGESSMTRKEKGTIISESDSHEKENKKKNKIRNGRMPYEKMDYFKGRKQEQEAPARSAVRGRKPLKKTGLETTEREVSPCRTAYTKRGGGAERTGLNQ